MSTENIYLQDQEYNKKRALWPFMKRIFTYGLRHKRWFYQLAIFTLLSAAIDAIYPLIWSHFIDDFIKPTVSGLGENQTIDWVKLWYYGGIYLIVIIAQPLFFSLWMFATGRIREHVIHDLREDMFNKLQHLSHSFFDKVASGWITIRLTSDVDKVAQVISWGFISLIYGVTMITASLVVMLFFNISLTLIVIGTVPVLLLLAIRVRLLLLKHARKARKLYSEMAANLTENINGVEVNKATVQELRAGENFQKISENFRSAAYKAGYFTSMYHPVVVMAGSVAAALVIYLGGHMAAEEYAGVTIGVLAAFFSYAVMIYEPIFDITYYYATAQDSLSAGERIFSLIDEPVEIRDKEDLEDFQTIKGDIEIREMDFHYLPEKPIIPKMTLKIEAGQSIALVGPTGEGKSTIVNLISRFYEPVHGHILIDGIDYRLKTLNSYRKQLGIIQQTPYLFSGTIQENIRYGKLDATKEEISNALEVIGAQDFISRLDEEVGEEGGNLSLGERQLISFTRAIIKDPRILIMDEATSSVDTLTEARIQTGVAKIIQGRTSIIIAHRLSTIKNCDRILVIRGGQVIEDGNHQELLKTKGAYYQLYTRQKRTQLV